MESIGQILKAARERRQMARSDVVTATKMTSAFVEAIEADNFGALVAPVYARGFIKLYAECVGLDPMPLLKQFGAFGRAASAQSQPPLPVRTDQASSKAPPMKASVAYAGKPKPAPEAVSSRSPACNAMRSIADRKAGGRTTLAPAAPVRAGARAPIPNPPLSWSGSLLAGRWPAWNGTFISRVQWPRFKKPNLAFLQIQLPVMVWRRIILVAGIALLIIAAGLAWEWSNRGMPTMTDACRWLAEPPAPYLTMSNR